MTESTTQLALNTVKPPEPFLTDVDSLANGLMSDSGLSLGLEALLEGRLGFDQLMQDGGAVIIQALLNLSVDQMLGPKCPGQTRSSGLVRFGSQPGVAHLQDRTVPITRPRVRRRLPDGTTREEPLPVYEKLSHKGIARQIGQIIINGVSTRKYKKTITRAAAAIGISRSAVSREFILESEAKLKELIERPLGNLNIVAVVLDGIIVGGHHILVAMGVALAGTKHVLGVRQGASENTVVVTALLEDLVARGLKAEVRRLFVIDGSKALRAGIRAVYGDAPVQRCRVHKLRNVCDQLPDDQRDQTKAIMKAAFNMEAKAGTVKLRKHISWLEREHPGAAGSLSEGLDEMFTVNRLELPRKLMTTLCSTNMIESPNSGLRRAIGRVARWRDGAMTLRWVGRALVDIELQWRAVNAASLLWILEQNVKLRIDLEQASAGKEQAA
jgi:transposase-like protein